MSNSSTSGTLHSGASFGLIWYYWFKRYMAKKNKKSASLQQLSQLKQKYKIESIETQGIQNAATLRKKIQQIREKTRCSSLNLPSSLSATTNATNSLALTNPPLFYTINPELQAKQIQEILSSEGDSMLDQQQSKQLINQLHSYYLNSKTIFIIYIYRQEKQYAQLETVSKLAGSSYGHGTGYGGEGSLLNSKLNLSSILNEDDSLGERNDSLLESHGYDKMEDKIDNLEILSKMVEIDGLEIWNVKYFSIPHCFVKVKKSCWARSFFCENMLASSTNSNTAALAPLPHPSQPKAICSLPLIPRITKHRPSIDKLQIFVSFLQQLWQKSPTMNPLCQSIFEYNGLPYIFTQDIREQSIAVLCYFIVYGNEEGPVTERSVERWMEHNPTAMLTKTIGYMREVVRGRNCVGKKEIVGKGLFDQSDIIW